jgi:hypothetical protein
MVLKRLQVQEPVLLITKLKEPYNFVICKDNWMKSSGDMQNEVSNAI